ncbi:MAG: L-threonylcarbamoyladenylate synthase [Myxococcota bacterium]
MILRVHPDNPQERLIRQVVKVLEAGGVIIYPTDTVYGFGCDLENRKAIERLYQLKQADRKKPMSIICPDLSQLSAYCASLPTSSYRVIKRLTPGAYTFILEASDKVPRMMLTRQRTIGIRVPDSPICQAILKMLGRPILSSSITLHTTDHMIEDPDEIEEEWGNRVELVLDGGILVAEPSSIVDLTSGSPEVIRVGKGDVSSLM